jgi:hypothetical protein
MRILRSVVCLLCVWVSVSACEAYDPPPTVELNVPSAGKWTQDTPLVLDFSEPIDKSSFHFTIWPYEYGPEGEIDVNATPLVSDCHVDVAPCGQVELAFNDAGDEVTLTHGELFADKTGVPYVLEVHAGLKDPKGRERKVPSIFEFQINPTQTTGAVEPNLNSGVMVLVADLTNTIPGIYLRLYVDFVVDKETGQTWLSGTVANLNQGLGYPVDTTDPEAMQLYDDHQGWALDMQGWMTALPDGKVFVDTEPRDVTVLVLGFIWVQLEDFRFEATIAQGSGPDGRDLATGIITSSRALMNGPEDPDDLGEVAAGLTMTGIFNDEIPEELPQLCDEDPCEHMNASGGDCQLAEPWVKAPACP